MLPALLEGILQTCNEKHALEKRGSMQVKLTVDDMGLMLRGLNTKSRATQSGFLTERATSSP